MVFARSGHVPVFPAKWKRVPDEPARSCPAVQYSHRRDLAVQYNLKGQTMQHSTSHSQVVHFWEGAAVSVPSNGAEQLREALGSDSVTNI